MDAKTTLSEMLGVMAVGRPPPCPGLTELALRLARGMPARAEGANLVFSPLSVYAGAGGETRAELLESLGMGSLDELDGLVGRLADRSSAGGPRVSFVSGVWHDVSTTLAPCFRDAAVGSFMAETSAVDFRTKVGTLTHDLVVNALMLVLSFCNAARGSSASDQCVAKKATNKLIDSIIDGGLPADTDVVVSTAVYFKGSWEDPFTKRSTKTDKFHRGVFAAAAVAVLYVHIPAGHPRRSLGPPRRDGLNARLPAGN
uniref:Serpin domain-containing protein n=1 Tax=Oryza brachyantha TaxID=4533 RepID=J3N711_ORYBR